MPPRPAAALALVAEAARSGPRLAELFWRVLQVTNQAPGESAEAFKARRRETMHGRGYATFWLAWHKERDLREAACTATVCVPRAPGREMRDGVRLRLPPTADEVVRA